MKAPPPTPFNVPPGPFRRFEVVEVRFDRFKQIKDALGGTVNDVVLAAVAGGLARFLHERGIDAEGMELRACVPVSVRTDATKASMGNEITIMMAPLPIGIADPVQRLARVREVMGNLKESKQALGAQAIAGLQDFAPPTIHAQASRLQFTSRMYNLLVTNVPGPQFPLYVLGAQDDLHVPDPVPGRRPGAGDRDHVLRRRDELRPARRLRRDAATSTPSAPGSRRRSTSSTPPPRAPSAPSSARPSGARRRGEARRQLREAPLK